MTVGSGLMSKERPLIPHLARAGKEVGDLRGDVVRAMSALRARCIEEYTDAPAAAADSILTAGAGLISSLVEQELLPADLDGVLGANLGYARKLVVTTGGATPAESPASMDVEGIDMQGKAVSETMVLSQVAGTDSSAKLYKDFTKITLPAGTGAGATFTFGHGDELGLTYPPKARAGGVDLLWEKESTLGVVATGTLTDAATDAPYGSYLPATVPDGLEDYAIEYEYDPTV